MRDVRGEEGDPGDGGQRVGREGHPGRGEARVQAGGGVDIPQQ